MPTSRKSAAFFDVDGTLVQSTIAHYYAFFRRRRIGGLLGELWYAAFAAKCGYYYLLDKVNRSRMNVVFYRSYRGLPVSEIKSSTIDCHREIIQPRMYPQAASCIAQHRGAGREIVLVTGSIDFIVAPLAQEFQASSVVAARLVESNGRFTGELHGPPIGELEKARRVRQCAEQNDFDLTNSYAFGDSIADLPMLETVGFPEVVNPDKSLAKVARQRGWPIHHWAVEGNGG